MILYARQAGRRYPQANTPAFLGISWPVQGSAGPGPALITVLIPVLFLSVLAESLTFFSTQTMPVEVLSIQTVPVMVRAQ